jgi:DHA2 family multidrug resistance protein
MLSINAQVHQNYLSGHVDAFHLSALTHSSTAAGALILRGGPEPFLGMIYLQVQKQASVLSYLDDFRMLSYIFFLLTPLVFFMRRPSRTSGAAPAAH